MNNLQPLNLLTTPNNNTSSTGEGQQQFANNSNNNVDQQTRQMALASLFSSLSSLASQQQPQPAPASQQNYHHLYNQQLIKQPPISSRTSPIMDTANPTFAPQTQLQQHRLQQPVAHATPTATSCNPISLSNSLQSVVAAAMMQQQLAATSQQQQPAAGNPFLQAGAEQAASLFGPRHFDQSEPMHQMSQQHHQYQQQQQLHPQSAQPQQRINYCTICNKELCNKYFMKTHMLKMHGINLEVEQPDGSDTTSRSSSGDDRERQGQATGENGDDDGDDDDDVDASKRVQVKKEQPAEESRYPGDWPSTGGGGGGKRKTSTGALKKSSSAQDSGASRKLSSGSGQQQKQAATSVMNGFAGNSMGGVVCDICNKELCSKYFLKVHKQNTHGIMTDYQDPNQFIYPFAAATNPFLVQPVGGPPPPAPAGALPFPPNPMSLFAPGGMHQPQQVEQPPAKKAKKARLSGNKINSIDKGDSFVAAQQPSAANDKQQQQFESVYRLLLAKQQQQPQHPPPPPPPIAFDPAAMGAATNPLSALMCFGAMGPATMGPFGPAAGLSAAMVVDNILRNQHLFHRATNQQQQQKSNGCTDSNKQSTSQNGKVSAGKEHSGGGGGSSRYFSHYTEACPMCERRFKSIKWLKTHMMNDHKQEIGAYMQMMMQYVYTSKSQQQQHQMMAASNIFEQQQMAQHLMASRSQQAAACGGHLATQVPQFNQLQQQQQQPQSQPRPTSLLSGKCAGGPTRAHANNLFQSQAQQPQQASVMMTNHEQQHQQLSGRGLSSQHPAQRHPALIMSHSSPLNSPMPTSTTSACHQLLNQRPNSNNNGADCDDDDAPQQAALDARCRRDTSLSPGAAINHDDADDLNHNTSPFRRAASGSPQSPLNRALLSGALSLAATRQSPASFATMSCLELDCNLSDGNNNTNNRAEGFSLLASDVHRSWDAISGCSSDDDDEDCERTERQVRDELLQPKQKQQQQQRQIRSGD